MRHIGKVLYAPESPENFYITIVPSSVWVHCVRFCKVIHDHLNANDVLQHTQCFTPIVTLWHGQN